MTEPDPGDTPPGRDPGEDLAYVDAVDELEAILAELESDEVDIDVLGARVTRASALIRLCRERVATARTEVEQVVLDLEATAAAAPEDGGTGTGDVGDGAPEDTAAAGDGPT